MQVVKSSDAEELAVCCSSSTSPAALPHPVHVPLTVRSPLIMRAPLTVVPAAKVPTTYITTSAMLTKSAFFISLLFENHRTRSAYTCKHVRRPQCIERVWAVLIVVLCADPIGRPGNVRDAGFIHFRSVVNICPNIADPADHVIPEYRVHRIGPVSDVGCCLRHPIQVYFCSHERSGTGWKRNYEMLP